ncbi:hypothetical protein M2284_001419 [Rhodococcus sp. LBL1]|nr:hypothetical protein [Rhodococcus sp. LBL1]MDH6682486.1 hypothetical protein [Rhodococcus sp. LBL2]
MSGFELLGRIAADIGGGARRALDAATPPIRIQVVGRAGVGRTAVAGVLGRAGFAPVTESSAVDAPGAADPVIDGDVVVYVLSGAPRTPDIDALKRAPRDATVVLVNKADLLGSWGASLRIAADCEAETGVRTLPSVTREPAPGTPDGVQDATAAVAACVRVVQARRSRVVLKTVAEAAARGPERDVLETYLRSDEAVQLAAHAAEASDDGVADRRRRELARRRVHARTHQDTPLDVR